MKNFFFILSFSISCMVANAQPPSYYYLKPGTEITLALYDKDSLQHGKIILTVMQTNDSDIRGPFNVITTTYNQYDSIVYKTSALAKYTEGSLYIGMSNFVPELPSTAKIKFSNRGTAWLIYPDKLSVGTTLPDSWLRTNCDINGTAATFSLFISNRKVIAKDTLNIGGKMTEAYKICYKYNYVIGTVDKLSDDTLDVIEWFVPGFGIIKSQTKNGAMQIAGL